MDDSSAADSSGSESTTDDGNQANGTGYVCPECDTTLDLLHVYHAHRATTHGAGELRSTADDPNQTTLSDGGPYVLVDDRPDRRLWVHHSTGLRVELLRYRGPEAVLTGTEPDTAEWWDAFVRPPESMGDDALKDLIDDRATEGTAANAAQTWMHDHADGVPTTYCPETAAGYHGDQDSFELATDGGYGSGDSA